MNYVEIEEKIQMLEALLKDTVPDEFFIEKEILLDQNFTSDENLTRRQYFELYLEKISKNHEKKKNPAKAWLDRLELFKKHLID